MKRSWMALSFAAACACGVPDPAQPELDAQVPVPPERDAGTHPVDDGGSRDARAPSDAGAGADASGAHDAGHVTHDAGRDADAGTHPRTDAGRDAGRDAGADAGRDAGSDAGHDAGTDAGTPTTHPPVFGVTITNPWVAGTGSGTDLRDELRALRSPTGRLPMARVVFDEEIDEVSGGDASEYVAPVRAIGADAIVMGELLDSFYMRDYSVTEYRARACEYRAELGHLVDVWEIGNEVNGEWLGSSVTAKLAAGAEVFRADAAGFAALCPGRHVRADERPYELALTLYYNGEYEGGHASATNCWEHADNAMLHWVDTHFTSGGDLAHLAGALDYVWVSYYEDDCNDLQPRWQDVIDRLGVVFPASELGIGECGTTRASQKARYVERYYQGMDSSDPAFANMHVSHPRYVGGFFWWYFDGDLDVPAVISGLHTALGGPFWSR